MDYKEINNLTKQLYTEIDSTISDFINKNKVKIDCKEGCSLCCKTPSRIELLPTEAFLIANHLKNTLKDQELKKLIDQLYKNKIKLQNKNLIECTKELTPCPLLINDSCSIYEIRPFVCRLLLSKDYNICLTYNNFQGHINGLLDNIFKNEIYTKYVKNIKDQKLFCEPIELNDVLYIILTTNCLNKYLKGDRNIFNELLEIDILKKDI